MLITVTDYLDVISSWCFWSEPTWAELKKRYGDRVKFQWKIALMDPSGLPASREQEQWFYRRSGMMMRSPFMLNTDWSIRVCRSGSRRIAWPKRPRTLAFLMIEFVLPWLMRRCGKARKSPIGRSQLELALKQVGSTPENCSSARDRRKSNSAFARRRLNFTRSKSRSAQHL